MAVMMATFVAVLWPRAAVCADAHRGGARHRVVGGHRARAPVTELPAPRHARAARRRLPLPGRRGTGALTDISFTARPARPPPSSAAPASGKTTLLNLVPRLFDATDGPVLVDGVDVRDLEPELLWSRIGLVPQKPYLFSGTVATNLRYADPDATDERALGGARGRPGPRLRGRHARRARRPIAQGGTNVSGGQRQRLAIARAARAQARASTCSTTRSRPSTSPPTPACGPRWPRSSPTPRC